MSYYEIPSNARGIVLVSDVCDAVNKLEPSLRRQVVAALREVMPLQGWVTRRDGAVDVVY